MGKKHKKKVYNTPKKIKHVREKISINKFINSFTNPKCMSCYSILAEHNDRYYCGKCNISIQEIKEDSN